MTRRTRHLISGGMIGLTYLAAVLATLPLLLILWHLLKKGASSLSLAFFTNMPKPVGEVGGGMANAIVGTLIMIGIASQSVCRSESEPASTFPKSVRHRSPSLCVFLRTY